MSRSERLLNLLQSLRRHRRPVSGRTLADELGVSLRTFYRDIATLQAQGANIEGEAGLGYVLRDGYFLPPLMFGDNELDAIILGLRFVMQRGDNELAQAAEDVLGKIEAVLPPGLEDAAATSGLLAGPGGSGKSGHLAAIREAIRREEKLQISYSDKKSRSTERIVWPIAVGFFDAAEMLAAWCETRHDFRHFRLDRIAAITPVHERTPRRHAILLAEWRLSQNLADML
ncbi:MAG: YafY family transcriptional regulator [Rhizobiales bacterium]|jgi:predicted DNA-binding transcriptional regulator YafY|nr:YafY family transcriptional regulator [Hyphomicrobiales bacterium]